jgi:hypothetical protein
MKTFNQGANFHTDKAACKWDRTEIKQGEGKPMKSFLELRVQVDLFHEPVNHSPLPWAGISYTLFMNPWSRVLTVLRKNWLAEVESAALSAVVAYYRRGVTKPTRIRLMLPYEGKTRILGIALHEPQTPAFWRRMRRLTPSGKRHDVSPARRRSQPKPAQLKSPTARLSRSSYARST